MNYLQRPNHFGNQKLVELDEASWPSIVDLIFEIVAHRDRLALKRKAVGKHKRRLARKHNQRAAR
jgi:hypothetical protein